MTAKCLQFAADSSCTACSAKGKVWTVQTAIYLATANASASWLLFAPVSDLIVATTPVAAPAGRFSFLRIAFRLCAKVQGTMVPDSGTSFKIRAVG